MKPITLYLGLDVHKESITIAVAQGEPKGEIRLFGTITNSIHALERALLRIRKAHGGAPVQVAYEAGPCGFGIARRLQQLAVPCLVAAPSLIPKQAAVKQAAARAGIPKRVSPHTFRHTFASHLLLANYDLQTIQRLLGHGDIKTTMIYLQTVPSITLKEAESPLDCL